MLPIDEARSRVLETVIRLGTERVPLMQALNRIAAEDVAAVVSVPPWDNAAMDGYAVRAADAVAGACLPLMGVVGAGSIGERLARGSAVAIMTGAPVPAGADAVVMIENTDGAQVGQVLIHKAAEAGQNIRRAGGDVVEGATVVGAGARLTPGKLGVLASVGCERVAVVRQPRVGILSTGNEIVRPGSVLGPGQIYSSNPYALSAWVAQAGGIPQDLGDAVDDLDALVAAMERGLQSDVLLTTGGVSMGRFDYVKRAFERLGVAVVFWKVAMKPGKPLLFGVAEREGRRIPIFGLPGNPVSCQVNFLMFVLPWLRASMGIKQALLPELLVENLEQIRERPGRSKLLRVRLERTERGWGARSTGSQSSGVGSSMSLAHGLLLRGPDEGSVEVGEQVRVLVFDPGFLEG